MHLEGRLVFLLAVLLWYFNIRSLSGHRWTSRWVEGVFTVTQMVIILIDLLEVLNLWVGGPDPILDPNQNTCSVSSWSHFLTWQHHSARQQERMQSRRTRWTYCPRHGWKQARGGGGRGVLWTGPHMLHKEVRAGWLWNNLKTFAWPLWIFDGLFKEGLSRYVSRPFTT